MAAYTAADVKALRERSGAGMMDCKKALEETNGDIEAAVDALRAKGLAAAAKKSSRTAAEGLVGVAVEGTRGRRGRGQLGNRLRRQERPVPGLRPQDHCGRARRVLGRCRGAQGRRLSRWRHGDREADQQCRHDRREPAGPPDEDRCGRSGGVVVPYMHIAAAPNLGKIGVLVALESEGDKAELEDLGKQIAMHIAAAFPHGARRRRPRRRA